MILFILNSGEGKINLRGKKPFVAWGEIGEVTF